MLNPAAIEVSRALREMETMLRRAMDGRVELVVGVQDDAAAALVDRGQLERTLFDVAANARDAMPNGGTLSIEISRLIADAARTAKYPGCFAAECIQISIARTGAGARTSVFVPLIESSSGSSRDVPVVGEGSAVREPTIFLVEDSAAVRCVVRRTLEAVAYHVVEAVDGREALEMIEHPEFHFDILVTDLIMPHVGGRMLVAALRERGFTVPVLFTSGYPGDTLMRPEDLTDHESFLEKPFTTTALTNRIQSMLGAWHAHRAADETSCRTIAK